MTSAYPIELTVLTEQVKALAVELGAVPSRNRVMSECKVGATKARAALDALAEQGFDPADPDPVRDVPARRLHSVPAEDTAEGAESDPVTEVVPAVAAEIDTPEEAPEVTTVMDPVPAPVVPVVESVPVADPVTAQPKPVRSWPLLLLAAGAFVSIWGGWVGLGEKAGFGLIRLLPGIADSFVINSAITLPIGVEAYAAYALRVWLSGGTRSIKARRFARSSAIGALVLGAAGQVAYHLMEAAGMTVAPWWITTFVSCLPVVVLGCGAALTHLLHNDDTTEEVQR